LAIQIGDSVWQFCVAIQFGNSIQQLSFGNSEEKNSILKLPTKE
jgi:hypothetical protein